MKRTGPIVRENTKTIHEPEKLDLIVRGGRVVTPEGVQEIEIGIVRGKIVRLGPSVTDETHQELDADGRYVFPGILDAHVHFNEPGRADWEGLATGSAALAAGDTASRLAVTSNARAKASWAARSAWVVARSPGQPAALRRFWAWTIQACRFCLACALSASRSTMPIRRAS